MFRGIVDGVGAMKLSDDRIAPFVSLFKFCATFFSLFIIGLYFTLYMYFFFLKEGPLKTSFAEGYPPRECKNEMK